MDEKTLTKQQALDKLSKIDFNQELEGSISVDEARRRLQPTTISSNDLKPERDFTLQNNPPVPIAGAEIQGAVEAQSLEQEERTKAKEAERTAKNSRDELLKSFIDSEGQEEMSFNAEKDAGVPEIERELNDINQKIRVEQTALRRQVEKIQDQPGLTRSQVNAKLSEVEQKSFRKQADLSLIQLGVQGRFDSAKAMADRAVAIQFERQEQKNAILEFQYNENKELFNKSEQRAFELKLNREQRALDKAKEEEQAKYDLAIEAMKNGASSSIVSSMTNASSKEEALEVGGQFIGLLDRMTKEASIANIYDQMRVRKQALADARRKGLEDSQSQQEEVKAETEAALLNKGFITAIKNHKGLSSAVGFGFGKTVRGFTDAIPFIDVDTKGAISGTEKANFISAHEQLVNSLTLDNLDLMSGVLSETDIKILSGAATRLKLDLSESSYLQEINTIEKTFDRAIKQNGVTPEQAEFYYGVDSSDLFEVDAIYGVREEEFIFNPANFY